MIPNPWLQVANELDQIYVSQYFYAQAYNDPSQNIMTILTPPQFFVDKYGNQFNMSDVCFGTKVLNIFIAQATYGWTPSTTNPGTSTFSWSTPSSPYAQAVNNAVAIWGKIYPRFSKYQTLIWTDLYTPTLLTTVCPNMGSQMAQVDTFLKTWCPTVPGFKYMGALTQQTPPSFFQPYIDQFYGNPPYRADS